MSSRQRKPASAKEILEDTLGKVEDRIENVLTVLWNDLPSWQQDNHYIHSGYRPASNSFKKSFASLGYLHNESVNIYSHLFGAIIFSVAGIFMFKEIKPRYSSAAPSDIFAFGCFFAGAAACLGMSATYHAISNHSPIVAKFGNKLDYVGIVSLITGSFIPCIFYGFYCHPHLQELYWTMICSLGAGCASVSIFERFRTPAWRPYRAGMFVAMGLSAVFPVLHGVQLYGINQMRERMGLMWILLEGFLYILGAGLYAARWPERSAPGSFDIWGSSHQIFHVLVVMAAASHLYGLLIAFDYCHGTGGLKC
ncbi:HlyIII-domain-containing protein [Coleophoma crateriformis]|uniref:HlyIII-domain-containing protein n=1 Tax=Coleophoma crateriformis TaxID=565419 RepID=A0A3D8T779_9HELO|nr:HlyIII-domain-containing protein [Coleophoma crateriformis]